MARILLVDDDDDIRTTVSAALAAAGHEMGEARNGRHALQLLAQGPLPSLIILDILMPIMDGFEFLDLMSHDPRISDIPVLAITAHARLASIPQVVSVLRKPFDLQRLLATVTSIGSLAGPATAPR